MLSEHCIKYARIREYTGQREPVFWHILRSGIYLIHFIPLQSFYIFSEKKNSEESNQRH